jgi:hypothetical protein
MSKLKLYRLLLTLMAVNFLWLIWLTWVGPAQALKAVPARQAEDVGDETRGFFLKTRPKGKPTDAEKKTPPRQRPPNPGATNDGTRTSPRDDPKEPLPEPGAIGVGITLYQRSATGDALRIPRSQLFYEHDRVRFVVEPNIDGYLYVFYTENDGHPEMIFPDHRLNQGANRIVAHVPYEAPSSKAENDWFVITENKHALNRLYFVVSRSPLQDIPIEKTLAAHCKGQDCGWRPTPKQFEPVLSGAKEKKLTHHKESLKQALAPVESAAITRGIKLGSRDPEPNIVYLNQSAKADLLVVAAELIQRPRP